MSNPGMRLTKLGENVLAKAVAGAELQFTRVALGDGDFDYESQRVYDLTDIVNWQMDLAITSVKVTGDGTTTLTTYNSNVEVVEGFAAREHAVYALDPDSGEEILYSYRNVGAEYDFIPANTGNAVKNIVFAYVIVVRDASNITAVIDNNFAYVSQPEFLEHIDSTHPHKNAPSHYLDVTETEYLWATDAEDSHLHKISLSNLKNSLKSDSPADVNSDFDVIRMREQLGIDANILLLEDFTDPSLVDLLNIKVTSCAKGGNLLGLATVEGLITGQYYWLGDGVSQEQVKVVSVISNASGLHAKIDGTLNYSYDANNCYLKRTTAQINGVATGAIDAVSFDWTPKETFAGYAANTNREISIDTGADKGRDFIIEGNGVLTTDGYLTMI